MIHSHPDYPELVYDSETGEMNWREESVYRTAFCVHPAGHLVFSYRGHPILTHRLCWLLYYGQWPEHTVDHVNGIPDDNAICNLRDVPHRTNTKNCALRVDNTSGFPGVYWHKKSKKWQAKMFVFGRSQSLGLFTNIEDAIRARRKAMQESGFHENHGRTAERGTSAHRIVRAATYTGNCPVMRRSEGLLNTRTGRVQLSKFEDTRISGYRKNPLKYGWHDLGSEWEIR